MELEFCPQKLNENVANQRRDRSDLEIGTGENVRKGPKQAILLPQARAFKFSHQQIRVEQEDNEPNLDQSPRDILLHAAEL